MTVPSIAPAQKPQPLPPAAYAVFEKELPPLNKMPLGLAPELDLAHLVVRQWTVDQGLPSNTLLDIEPSSDGFLWIASYNGLIRFDSLAFEVFERGAHQELTTSAFVGLSSGKGGGIWVGTQGSGLWRLEDHRLSPIALDLESAKVLSVLDDDSGNPWLGLDTGLRRVTNGEVSPREVSTTVPWLNGVPVNALLEDVDGSLWIASEEQGLGKWEGGELSWLTPVPGPAATSLRQYQEELWVGTLDGPTIWDGQKLKPVAPLEGFAVNAMAVDGYENLWLVGPQGLSRLHGSTGEIEIVTEVRGVRLHALSAIAFDPEGSLWLTSMADGLLQLRPATFHALTQADGLSTPRVSTVFEQGPGHWLLGMDDGVVHRVKNGVVSDLSFRHSLEGLRIWDMVTDRQGTLWVATYSGLLRVAGDREEFWTVAGGLPSNQIRAIHEDQSGHLWLATQNAGLVRLKSSETPDFEAISVDDGLAAGFVFSIDETSSGELIIGTLGGLSRLTPGAPGSAQPFSGVQSYTDSVELPGLVVFNTWIVPSKATYDDSEEEPLVGASESDDLALWLATDGGLGRLEAGRFFKLQVTDGMPVEAIFDVHQDDTGQLWMSSSIGVIRADVAQVLSYWREGGDPPWLEVFSEQDGMSHRQCTGAVPFTALDDGRLLFPTFGGLSILDPSRIVRNGLPPRIAITQLRVDGEEAEGRPPFSIAPGAKRLSIDFDSLSFVDPEATELWYRLEGFDEPWQLADDRRQALYTNLDPGRYRFRVVGANADRIWNREGASMIVHLERRFYENPWFRAFGVLFLAVFLQRLVAWRVRTAQRRSSTLQRVVDRQRQTARENRSLIEELRKKNEELERFTYTVSHDLKSPLVTIRGFAGALHEDLIHGDIDRAEEDLKLIQGASKRMERLLRELEHLTRVGHIQNPPEHASLTELAQEAMALTAGDALARRAKIKIQPEMPTRVVDRSRMIEVFQNLIENALKFSKPGLTPRIEIGCLERKGEAVFFVQDNGIGIAKAQQGQVFGLFKRLSHRVEGTGVGLTIVQRTIQTHGGEIWVESEGQGRGARFSFTLPGLSTSSEGARSKASRSQAKRSQANRLQATPSTRPN